MLPTSSKRSPMPIITLPIILPRISQRQPPLPTRWPPRNGSRYKLICIILVLCPLVLHLPNDGSRLVRLRRPICMRGGSRKWCSVDRTFLLFILSSPSLRCFSLGLYTLSRSNMDARWTSGSKNHLSLSCSSAMCLSCLFSPTLYFFYLSPPSNHTTSLHFSPFFIFLSFCYLYAKTYPNSPCARLSPVLHFPLCSSRGMNLSCPHITYVHKQLCLGRQVRTWRLLFFICLFLGWVYDRWALSDFCGRSFSRGGVRSRP